MAEVCVFADQHELGEALADDILSAYDRPRDRRFLLGCPGGRSLRSTYRALAARGHEVDDLVIVMMDEYVEDGRAAPADAHYSCRRFALGEIARPLGIADDRVWLPDPADPATYDRRIAAAGGIDLFLLASGASDGHVAMLGPGARLESRTSAVDLAETTRRDNLATFPEFGSLEEVPRRGVSVGLATIRAARSVRLALHGPGKREAAAQLLARDAFDPAWPASVVYACADAEIWLDRAAAS